MSAVAQLRLGIVSNCWKVQLDDGQTLKDLVDEAARRGFGAIELRQGFLGEYESCVADAHSSAGARHELAELSLEFPTVDFNLAVSLPIFGGLPLDDDARFVGAMSASMALARDGRPHLRLVDTETRIPNLDDDQVAQAGAALAAMTRLLVNLDGFLSIEHAYQPWSVFWSTLLQARGELDHAAARLRCCFDPCNLLLTESSAAVPAVVESIRPGDVSMIHLKQRSGGQIQTEVAGGDLDWALLMRMLRAQHHQGPWLFEVAPHSDIWGNLDRSIRRLFG